MKYHNDFGRQIIVNLKLDMRGAQQKHEARLKKPLSTVVIPKKRSGEDRGVANVVDLDVREGKPL